jgi:hypothetical protein
MILLKNRRNKENVMMNSNYWRNPNKNEGVPINACAIPK